jgi:hypothetical protein
MKKVWYTYNFENPSDYVVTGANLSFGTALNISDKITYTDLGTFSGIHVANVRELVNNTWENLGVPPEGRIHYIRVSEIIVAGGEDSCQLVVGVKSNNVWKYSNIFDITLFATTEVTSYDGEIVLVPNLYDPITNIELNFSFSNVDEDSHNFTFILYSLTLEIGYTEDDMNTYPTVQRQQTLGVESTAGTAVTPTVIIAEAHIMFEPKFSNTPIKRAGIKPSTGIKRGFEHAEAALTGTPGFNSMLYWLQNHFVSASSSAPAKNGIFTVTITGATGNFTLTYSGQTTGNIAHTVAASQSALAGVVTALEALSTIGVGNVAVTFISTGVFTIQLVGALANSSTTMTGTFSGLTGGTPTIAGASGSSSTWDYTFTPVWQGADTTKIFTIQEGIPGVSGSGDTFSFAVLRDLSFSLSNKDSQISGQFIAQKPSVNVTPTTVSPTFSANPGAGLLPVVPMDIGNARMYIGDNLVSASAGLTRIPFFDFSWKSTGRWVPKFPVDSNYNNTFSDVVEHEATYECEFAVEHNTAAQGIFDNLRSGKTQALVFEVDGGIIEGSGVTAYNYLYKTQMFIKLKENSRQDIDGVYSSRYPCEIIYDSTAGYFMQHFLRCAVQSI